MGSKNSNEKHFFFRDDNTNLQCHPELVEQSIKEQKAVPKKKESPH
jgi:hypothetical protein